MFRIFFVLLAAAIITFASVLIGLHLMRKVQEAENTPSSAVGEGISAGSSYSGETPVLAKVKDVFGMGLVIGDYPTDEELDGALDALAESYDTVVFPLCDESGNLIYQSPAVCALVRMQPEDAEGLGRVTHALSAAKSRGLYVIVSVNASDSASSSAASSAADAALMGELASFGADEILVFPGTDTFDYGTANRLRRDGRGERKCDESHEATITPILRISCCLTHLGPFLLLHTPKTTRTARHCEVPI